MQRPTFVLQIYIVHAMLGTNSTSLEQNLLFKRDVLF
jgi:hypothetical protein